MNRTTILLSTALATLVLIATPAVAGQRGGGHNRGGGGAPRGAAPTRPTGGGGPSRTSQPRTGQPRTGGTVRVDPRGGGPRGGVVAPSRTVASRSFYRPYYTFRPRISLGFGLWAGYPFAYPYSYGYYGYPYGYAPYYSYPYPYPYAYPAYSYPAQPQGYPAPSYPAQPAAPGSIDVQPGVLNSGASSGGVSFDIAPDTTEVYIDGTSMGTAGTFGPTSQPLTLSAGRHRIQLRAAGYDSLAFAVDVIAGQVIPYQGSLTPLGTPQRPS